MKNYTFLVQKTQKIVSSKKNFCTNLQSPPCGGVDWNELQYRYFQTLLRHHLAVVWIEIPLWHASWNYRSVTTLRWCGLKSVLTAEETKFYSHHLAVVWIEITSECVYTPLSVVTTLRWCGLKLLYPRHLAVARLSPPCGGVDWNDGILQGL